MNLLLSLRMVTIAVLLASTTHMAFANVKNYKDEVMYKDAAVCPACVMPTTLKGGFYVGAQGGYDVYGFKSADPDDDSNSINIHIPGWTGGILFGYGYYFDRFYLGAEAVGNYTSAEDTFGNLAYVKFKTKSGYGISILPGVKLNDATLGYLKVGYKWTNFKIQGNAFDNDNGVVTNFPFSKSSTQGGVNYGLGIEAFIHENWSIRGEYTYTSYNSFGVTSPSGESLKVSPSDNQFMLGLLYHFA